MICRDSYIITLSPGGNVDAVAMRCASVVIDRWLPQNRGGVHLMMGPRLAAHIAALLHKAAHHQRPIRVRVTIEGNIPVLTELPMADRHACAN